MASGFASVIGRWALPLQHRLAPSEIVSDAVIAMPRAFSGTRNHRGPYVQLADPVVLSEADVRAIFSVLDAAVYNAGRTSVMMALRGSRAQRVKRLGLVDQSGHGHFAGMKEAEVMARIDTCFHRGWLEFERTREGLPLLAYTAAGLAKAKGYVVEEWFEELKTQVEPVAGGQELALSFLLVTNPQRNQDTVLELVDRIEQSATSSWLPLLRAWRTAETKRLRKRLRPLIEKLERNP